MHSEWNCGTIFVAEIRNLGVWGMARFVQTQHLLLLLLLSVCMLSACGRSGPGAASAPELNAPAPGNSPAELPAPQMLLRQPGWAGAASTRWLHEVDPELPRRHIFQNQFSPQGYPDNVEGLKLAAYGTFHFGGFFHYEEPELIRLAWEGTAPGPSNVFVALANFDADRWDWYPVDEAYSCVPRAGQYPPYVSQWGDVLVVVVVCGYYSVKLDYLLLNDNVIPPFEVTDDLYDDPIYNYGPLDVDFDASAARCIGGTIESFDFDWETDGVWDLLGDADGLASHVYDAGNWRLTVRANGGEGLSRQSALDFLITDNDNIEPQAAFTASVLSGPAPLAVDFDASSSVDPDGELIRYEWDFGSDGHYDQISVSPLASRSFVMQGVTTVTLRVTDRWERKDTAMLDITCDSGFSSVELGEYPSVYWPLAMCTSGTGSAARACIAFASSALSFARAQTESGSAWNSFTDIDYPSGGAEVYMQDCVSLASSEPDGIPIVAYGMYDWWGPRWQCVKTATDPTGSSWSPRVDFLGGAWGGHEMGWGSTLSIINGKPALVGPAVLDYQDAGLRQPVILYLSASDALGQSWDPWHMVASVANEAYAGSEGLHAALGYKQIDLEQLPLAAYCKEDWQPAVGSQWLTGSLDPSGQWWGHDYLMSEDSMLDWVSAGSFAGEAAVLYSSRAISNEIRYMLAVNVSDPGFSGELQTIGFGACARLFSYQGRPAVCYYDSDGGDLCLLTAVDETGSSWNAPYTVETAGDVGSSCGVTVVNGKPVLAYFERPSNVLKVAYWQD